MRISQGVVHKHMLPRDFGNAPEFRRCRLGDQPDSMWRVCLTKAGFLVACAFEPNQNHVMDSRYVQFADTIVLAWRLLTGLGYDSRLGMAWSLFDIKTSSHALELLS